MFSKCIQYHVLLRNQVNVTLMKTLRTSALFKSEAQPESINVDTKESNHGSKKKVLLDAIKEHKQSNSVTQTQEKESIRSILKVQKVTHKTDEFKMIYKFPYIHYFAIVNRLKAYQTVFSVLASVGVTGLYAFDVVPLETFTTTIGLAASGCLMFYSLGFAAARFIGLIYFNERTNMVRIAYIDFWGRRRDIEVLVNDIVPRSEMKDSILDAVWHPVERYSSKERLKLQLEQGKIFDREALKKIL